MPCRSAPTAPASYVTGDSIGSGGDTDFATVAYDAANGARIWVGRYKGVSQFDDNARAIAVSPDGTLVFVTGESYAIGTSYDYATVAYDAASGAQVWVERYNGEADQVDVPSAIGVSPDGTRVYVTGYTSGSTTSEDYATVAYDAVTGDQLWVQRLQRMEERHRHPGGSGCEPRRDARVRDGILLARPRR